MRYVEVLSQEEEVQLQAILHTSDKHRTRVRAQAILLSPKGYKLKVIADICQVNRDTVSQWLRRWEQDKMDSLSDATRCGRPSRLSEDEKKRYWPMQIRPLGKSSN